MRSLLFDRVSIIIPQWNQWELTADCVSSLRRFMGSAIEIIVVDDGSSERSVVLSERFFSKRVRFERQEWSGISKAWNSGANAVRKSSEYLVFLNNDVISFGDWVTPLVSCLIESDVSMAGNRLRNEARLPSFVLQNLLTKRFLEGWCLAIRRTDFEFLNGFDERMALYWSDTDFQLRLLRHCQQVGRAAEFKAFSELPLKHIGHRTSRRHPEKSRLWNADRAAFLEIWGK